MTNIMWILGSLATTGLVWLMIWSIDEFKQLEDNNNDNE